MKKGLSVLVVIVCVIVAVILLEHKMTNESSVESSIDNEQTDTVVETPPKEAEGYSTGVDGKSGVVFTYPTNLGYQYVSTPQWPPRFTNSIDPIKCELDEQTRAMSGATSRTEVINGNTYCIWETAEGAAGSIYKTYQVIYPKSGQYLTMGFTLKFPQCLNYPDEQVAVCQTEQDNFPLNDLIDTIAQSAYLPE